MKCDTLPADSDTSQYAMDCAIYGKWHMHIYFDRNNGERRGSRFYHNNGPSSRPDKTLLRTSLLWSEGPMRHCVSLQEFVDGVLGNG